MNHFIKSLTGLFLLFALSCCSNQDKKTGGVPLPDRLAGYYNDHKHDSIFYLFSEEMKETLPLRKTREFFSQLQKNAGKLEKYILVTREENFNRYRAEFTNAFLWMDLSQNSFGKIDGLLFTPYDGPPDTSNFIRNKTPLSLPFSDEWFVFWGGDTKEQNYHIISRSQRHAMDLVITDTGQKTYRTDGRTNEDYYAFGRPVLAPCDAEVTEMTDGVKDNIPGEMNPEQPTGNTVLLKSGEEYLLFAHFKMNSIRVKPGEKVKKGQWLGLCGNSGNSSEPHIHFHMQDRPGMEGAKGIKSYFNNLLVNGVGKTEYSPVKGEKIRNAD